MFSGSQSHRGKSQSPVAWITAVEETNLLKLIDKAVFRMVSESPGRNASEPTGSLVRKQLPDGRALSVRAKTALQAARWLKRHATPAGW